MRFSVGLKEITWVPSLIRNHDRRIVDAWDWTSING
ncbi:uncharacterized protein G2W53_005284 [Senna tora]|uniref:Uncharacterized protein n=1 Tax=Senna tora TaxID=362788 RepID=A0A835CIY9_9FABA|nr:uncharacterized protein G2W53_005284 [Senna tora]